MKDWKEIKLTAIKSGKYLSHYVAYGFRVKRHTSDQGKQSGYEVYYPGGDLGAIVKNQNEAKQFIARENAAIEQRVAAEQATGAQTEAAPDADALLAQIRTDLRQLAYGTLASLTGNSDGNALDEIHAKLMAYAAEPINANPYQWATWQDVWNDFGRLHPEYRKSKWVSTYTTAPVDYDGFSTRTVNPHAGVDSGKVVRLVECEERDLEWQRSRYASGLCMAASEPSWRALVQAGIARETGVDEPAVDPKPEPMPSADRVTMPAPIADADVPDLVCHEWPNRLGWDVIDRDGQRHEVLREGNQVTLDVQDGDGNRPTFDLRDLTISTPQESVRQALALLAERQKASEPVAVVSGEQAQEQPAVHDDFATAALEGPRARQLVLLPPAVKALGKLAARDGVAKFGGTSGLNVKATGRGFRVEATNGKVLGVLTGDCDSGEEFFEPLPALKTTTGGVTSAVVPLKAIEKACQAVPKGSFVKEVFQNVAVALGEQTSTLGTFDADTPAVLQPRNVEGRFPNVDLILKGFDEWGPPAVAIQVDPKQLADLLLVAREFNPDGITAVTLEFWGADKLIRVRSGGQGREFTGVLVPMVVKNGQA